MFQREYLLNTLDKGAGATAQLCTVALTLFYLIRFLGQGTNPSFLSKYEVVPLVLKIALTQGVVGKVIFCRFSSVKKAEKLIQLKRSYISKKFKSDYISKIPLNKDMWKHETLILLKKVSVIKESEESFKEFFNKTFNEKEIKGIESVLKEILNKEIPEFNVENKSEDWIKFFTIGGGLLLLLAEVFQCDTIGQILTGRKWKASMNTSLLWALGGALFSLMFSHSKIDYEKKSIGDWSGVRTYDFLGADQLTSDKSKKGDVVFNFALDKLVELFCFTLTSKTEDSLGEAKISLKKDFKELPCLISCSFDEKQKKVVQFASFAVYVFENWGECKKIYLKGDEDQEKN